MLSMGIVAQYENIQDDIVNDTVLDTFLERRRNPSIVTTVDGSTKCKGSKSEKSTEGCDNEQKAGSVKNYFLTEINENATEQNSQMVPWKEPVPPKHHHLNDTKIDTHQVDDSKRRRKESVQILTASPSQVKIKVQPENASKQLKATEEKTQFMETKLITYEGNQHGRSEEQTRPVSESVPQFTIQAGQVVTTPKGKTSVEQSGLSKQHPCGRAKRLSQNLQTATYSCEESRKQIMNDNSVHAKNVIKKGTPDYFQKPRSLHHCNNHCGDSDVIHICSIHTGQQGLLLQSPESQKQRRHQRQKDGSSEKSQKSIENYDDKNSFSCTPHSDDDRQYPRSIFPVLSSMLRVTVVLFSTFSLIAQSLTAFGGKMSVIHYIINSPILWTVRFYVAVTHVTLILVEVGVRIPIIIPKGTLDNFVQRGYVQSFIGLLDVCMNSNKSLMESMEELRSGSLTRRGRRMRVSFAILRVSSRGLVACGILYFVLGFFGFDERSWKRMFQEEKEVVEDVGLMKKRSSRN